MKLRILAATVWVSLISGGVMAQEATQNPPKSSPGKPKIKFDQTVYDFGKTSQVEQVKGVFTFQNVGDGELRIGKPTTTCGCTVAGVKPEVLQPGERGELAFSLNLGRTRQIFHKQIIVDSNDPESPKTTLSVKADYTPLYTTTPVSFYTNLRKGDTTNLTATVTRTDGKPFKISKITPTQPWIEAKIEPVQDSAGQSVRIVATLKPEGSPRYYSEFLNVFVDNSEQPAFNVTFSGRLLGDLVVTPESLYWPITDPQKVVTMRKVIMRSSLPDKLELKNVTSTLKEVAIEAVPKEDGKTIELVARLVSVPEKTMNGVIRLETNVPSQPQVEVPVWINVTAKTASPVSSAVTERLNTVIQR